MVILIPYSLDELAAMGPFMMDAQRKGKSIWRMFWIGEAVVGSDDSAKEFCDTYALMIADMVDGAIMPKTLLVSAALGVWLMFTRLTIERACDGQQRSSARRTGGHV